MTRHVLIMFFYFWQWCNLPGIEALKFSSNYSCILPATAHVFAVIANMCSKSIQKQIVEYDIKSQYPEEYSTIDGENVLASKSCFVWNKDTLTAAVSLACLEIRSRNEEVIISTKKQDLLAEGFLLPNLSTSIRFICFWIDLVRLLATTRTMSGCRLYTCINTQKFKGLGSREITSLPEIQKVIYMARHFNHWWK